MKRIVALLLACAFVMGALAAPAMAAKTVVIKIAGMKPEGEPETVAMHQFGKYLEELSGGKYKVQVFPNSQLGKEDAYIASTRKGIIQMCATGTQTSAIQPSMAMFETPMLFDDYAHARRAMNGGKTVDLITQGFTEKSGMRVLNAYCGLDHKVKLMALGRPLLEEQTPEGIGNYAAILSDPEYNDAALLEKLKNFLEDMQWEGFANMDIKYDARTGEYKMFEMNPRQGRSSYFVTAAGYNLSKWLVEDVLEHKELGLTIADTKSLWMIAPYGVIKKYLKDPDLLARADKLKKEGKCAHQLFCKEDWNLKRWLWYIRSQLNYYRKTARYYGNKGLRD